jgi:hypothetical protein
LDYRCGDISEAEFLKVGEGSTWLRSEAHYEIAITRLAEGDRVGAREHFLKATQDRLIMRYTCDWSRSFLARLDKDPAWPPWIPVKK